MDQEEELEQEPSFYAIIPATVRYDKSLPVSARLLYGEITSLCNKKGYCWASNNYFAGLYDVDKDTVSVWIGRLKKAGYIKVVINQSAGNKRRIYITEKLSEPIDEKKDRYPEKTGDLSRKKQAPTEEKSDTYPEKDRHNIIVNNKENNAAAPAPMGEGVFSEPIDESLPPTPPVAPAPLPPKKKYGDGELQKMVRAFILANPNKYPTPMYINFLEKWTMIIDHSADNPSHAGKEKWRTQSQWIVETRLENWYPGWHEEQKKKPLNQQSNEPATRPSKANSLYGNSQTGSSGKQTKRLGLITPGALSGNRQNPGDKN